KIVSVIPEQGRLVAALSTSEDTARASDELGFGSVVEATITAVRQTQLNVKVGKTQLGRIDISEIFDDWTGIADPKKPLAAHKKGDTSKARVLGTHDSRNHRFLPCSHRGGEQVLELTAKPSALKSEPLEALT